MSRGGGIIIDQSLIPRSFSETIEKPSTEYISSEYEKKDYNNIIILFLYATWAFQACRIII